mgnify:CR=1 FL=1
MRHMTRLRARESIDRTKTEVRGRRQRWTQYLYLGLLGAGALWLANLFLGPHLYLQSKGIVLAESINLSSEFLAAVETLDVDRYEKVREGQELAHISSYDVQETVTEMTARLADLQLRLGELEMRLETRRALEAITSERAELAEQIHGDLESLAERKLLPIDKRLPIFEAYFRSHQDLEQLRAEVRTIESQIGQVTAAVWETETALAQLKKLYRDGRILAPMDGVVTQLHVAQGSVVRPGEPLLQIDGGPHYVLAFLPSIRLFDVSVGQTVRVRHGASFVDGVIERIEPVATALPQEFQRAFRPQQQGQVMRVELDRSATPPPLHAAVEVLHTSALIPWTPMAWTESGPDRPSDGVLALELRDSR